ncbi:MAG: hypothetical protein ACKVVT_19605 [Dehalococcoidia bacterium]
MIRDQKKLARMSEMMREGRYEEATRDFVGLLKDGVNAKAMGLEAITAASPFLNVPAHTMVTKTGETRPVNYDHTVLGFWRAQRMSKMMPKGYQSLPATQAMWYLPQGIDIWSQILCEFPGHYSKEQEKCPTITLKGPRQHFEEHPPYTEGTWDERLALMVESIMHGDRVMAFRAFLGLADDAAIDEIKRRELEAAVIFTGIIDLPGPRTYHIHIVNSAHKAIRARAMVDLANALGWENAYPIYLIVIPDLASNPRFHDIYETAHIQLIGAFGQGYYDRRHAQTKPMSVREAEEFITLMTHGAPDEVIAGVTKLLKDEKSLIALNDVCIIAAARMQAKLENPSIRTGFTNTDHCFDYTNVVGYWLRTYDHPQALKMPYYTALFVNDTARFLKKASRDANAEFQSQPEEHMDRAAKLTQDEALKELLAACDAQDGAYATALLETYMSRTRDRKKLIDTLVFENGKWEGDPHLPRNAMSHHEEYLHSTLPLSMRDDLFRSWTRFVSRWHKRSMEFNCLRLYEDEFRLPGP